LEAAVYWINFGADGWRLDVPAEINDDAFWQEFRRRVKEVNPEAYIVGELWHESKRWLQGDQFDAVMNYLLTGALMGWLIGDRLPPYIFKIGDYHKYLHTINAEEFADRIDYLLSLYDPAINSVQFNLLDSHDTPRFLTTSGNDLTALKLGWLFLFTYVGAPCIYYGDEIGLSGGPDPECRGAFTWDTQGWNVDLHDYAKCLISLRHTHPALRRGTFQRLYAKECVFAFIRHTNEETILVVINSGIETAVVDLPAPVELGEGPVTTLLGKADAQFANGQIKDLKIAPRSGLVFGKSHR
jgi:neopullulanase